MLWLFVKMVEIIIFIDGEDLIIYGWTRWIYWYKLFGQGKYLTMSDFLRIIFI